jgi:hypothetical protein
MFVLARIESGELKLEIEGRDIKDSTTLERTTIPTTAHVRHTVHKTDWEGCGVIHYKEWFRFVRERSANGFSFEKTLDQIPDTVSFTATELIGLTTDQRLVYGVKLELTDSEEVYTVLAVFPKRNIPMKIPEDLRDVIPTETPASTVQVQEVTSSEMPEQNNLSGEQLQLITSWWEAHLSYSESRSQDLSEDPMEWFRHYMSHQLAEGERMGAEHLDLYNHLRQQRLE